jgi:RHS repeat-associated protein
VTYLYHDHLGSAVASGDQESARYWPYGESRAGEINTAYKYTGQELDAASGLYYYRARWYDASIGKFIQADTLVPAPGNPQSLNRYAYVYNNPLRYTDPSGRYGQDVHEYWAALVITNIAKQVLMSDYGLNPLDAETHASGLARTIAEANHATDRLVSLDNSALPTHSNVHFLSHRQAQGLMEGTLRQYEHGQPASPADFGRALHAVQDYHRHRGLGFTAMSGRFGQMQYLWHVVCDGEQFDFFAFLLDARNWGHLQASVREKATRHLFPSLWSPALNPDAPLGSYPGDNLMIEETVRYVGAYVAQFYAWSPPSGSRNRHGGSSSLGKSVIWH